VISKQNMHQGKRNGVPARARATEGFGQPPVLKTVLWPQEAPERSNLLNSCTWWSTCDSIAAASRVNAAQFQGATLQCASALRCRSPEENAHNIKCHLPAVQSTSTFRLQSTSAFVRQSCTHQCDKRDSKFGVLCHAHDEIKIPIPRNAVWITTEFL
jgi:hypothetical protein